MEINNLKILLDVARHQSFASVARQLNVDPSSISRIIAGLETELGIRLFQRSTRSLTITEAGTLYLSKIEPLMEGFEKARDDARNISNTPSGTLKLTASVAFGQVCLVPLLPEFRKIYPDLQLDLHLNDANVDLVADRRDLALRLGPALTGDLIGTKLMDTYYRVVASPVYLKKHRVLKSPEDLQDHTCLVLSLAEHHNTWSFRDNADHITDIPVNGDIVLSTPLALKQAAMQGLGPVLLANWMIDREINSGSLINIFPDHQATATSFETSAWALYPSRTYLPYKVRVMIDFLKTHLGRLRPLS